MASVPSVTSSIINQSVQPKNQINIDLESLKEWCGIKPDEIGIGYWIINKELPTVDADQAIDKMDAIDSENSEFDGQPAVQFTFRSAVRLVVAVINRNIKLAKGDTQIPLFCPGGGGYLLSMLSNIETKLHSMISPPPQYVLPTCSARSTDHNFWLGVVLQRLYEEGHISAYGRKGCEYWFSI